MKKTARKNSNEPILPQWFNIQLLTEYTPETFVQKNIWDGNVAYNEPVMFNTSDGRDNTTKQLIYPIVDVIAVFSFDRKTQYVKGVDFDITEDGRLKRLEGGNIPLYTGPLTTPITHKNSTHADLYDPSVTKNGSLDCADFYNTDDTNGLYIMWDVPHEKSTVYVTYYHTENWEGVDFNSAKPHAQGDKLTAFYQKLKNKETINVLIYGDSTATGCTSSGAQIGYHLFDIDGNVMPNSSGFGIKAPSFFEQSTAEIVRKYGNENTKINYYNLAVCGKTTNWGIKSLETRLGYLEKTYQGVIPDLIYIKFSANDLVEKSVSIDTYKSNIAKMVKLLQNLYPEAAIVLVSGKLNNEKCVKHNREKAMAMENALVDIANSNVNCIVAENTSVWVEIVKSKAYEDYISNNINHANDYWAMVTAQVIVASMKKE